MLFKKVVAFFLFLFISTGFIYSGEVTLGLGLRISNKGLVPGEYSLPFSLCRIVEYPDPVYGTYRRTETTDYVLGKVNSFQRRAFFLFGVDFSLRKGFALGFEVSAGFLKRNYSARMTKRVEVDGELIYESTREEEKDTTIIIPANFFIVVKYRFKKSLFRPYFGIGGGLSAAVFLKGITEFEDSKQIGEKEFTYSGALMTVVGADVCFSKKVAVFVECRYVKPLSDGRNFRDQAILGIGLRLI